MICYLYTFPNGKQYCGITHNTIEARASGRYKGQRVGYAIEKYGWDNVKKEILFESDDEEFIKQKEIDTIAELDLMNPLRGYNVSPGGNMQPLEIRQQIGKSVEALWKTEEYRNRVIEADKNRVYTEERNQKIRDTLRQQFIDNPELREERSRKLKEAYMNGHRDEAMRRSIEAKRTPVAKYDDAGNLIAIFPSNVAAYREYNPNAKVDKAIYRVLNGSRGHYKGYVYKKISKEEEEILNGILRTSD